MTIFNLKGYFIFPVFGILLLSGSGHAQSAVVPVALRVDLLLHTDKVWQHGFVVSQTLEQARSDPQNYQAARIGNSNPRFSWVVNSNKQGASQSAYQVLIASSAQKLQAGIADVWNSGKIVTSQQLNIEYSGNKLRPNTVYYWRVKIWDNKGVASVFSKPSAFLTDSTLKPCEIAYTPLIKTVQQPLTHRQLDNGNELYDFGQDAFGQLSLLVHAAGERDTLRIHVGEAVDDRGAVQRNPKGTIRYRLLELPLKKGTNRYNPVFTADPRNTGPKAIRMPAYIGEVLPFRYAEIESQASTVKIAGAARYAVNYIFDDTATEFESSDTLLNQVWALCKYTMKATSFTGLYVDGDRERIPYEADALINQLSHYAVDAELNMAKRSLEYLIYNATWPTEWSLQNLQIAWNDYLYSGDIRTVKKLYGELQPKLLLALARPDGLISTRTGKQDSAFTRSIHLNSFDGKALLKDIVDWPQKGGFGLPPNAPGESDSFEFTDYNSVVNAFHYQALRCMQRLAQALGKESDAALYQQRALKVKQAFQQRFIDTGLGIVKDGEDTKHCSLHANMMALAFGLIPEENKAAVLSFIRSKGMACSVYGAQFLLDALYEANEADYGLQLLTARDKRSWYNMLSTGSTMTTEAWDTEYKNNQDWNHAWGSAPANIIVRKLMGVTPLSPGFGTIAIKPRAGTLHRAQLKLATLSGRVGVAFEQGDDSFDLETRLPANTKGVVYLPRRASSDQLFKNGKRITGIPDGDFWVIKNVEPGTAAWKVHYLSKQ
ncbi:MAG: alpha-L-rhamnosidase C-terminal domain-containing protein [Niabella sp.]